jgi:hypothetical protein
MGGNHQQQMLGGYYDYQQQILDAFHQNPFIKGNLQDAKANHLFFGVHHAT